MTRNKWMAVRGVIAFVAICLLVIGVYNVLLGRSIGWAIAMVGGLAIGSLAAMWPGQRSQHLREVR